MTLCDVGPRDGLQNEPETLGPELRAELVRRLAMAGLPRIEAASFVSDERVPQMAAAARCGPLWGVWLRPRGVGEPGAKRFFRGLRASASAPQIPNLRQRNSAGNRIATIPAIGEGRVG